MVVTKLRPEESVHVDRTRLDELYSELGISEADNVVTRAMEELALRLAKVEKCYNTQDFVQMKQGARSMIAISEQIGMKTFATAAASVHELALGSDSVALAATVERLTRAGENSLIAVWDLQGASL